MRDRGWRRKKDFSKAQRKKYIDLAVSYYNYKEINNVFCPWQIFTQYGLYDNLHQYSKNKIHCSCPRCSPRTRNKGKHRGRKNYAPSINYNRHDKRKYDSMIEEEKEFIYGEENNSIME